MPFPFARGKAVSRTMPVGKKKMPMQAEGKKGISPSSGFMSRFSKMKKRNAS